MAILKVKVFYEEPSPIGATSRFIPLLGIDTGVIPSQLEFIEFQL